MQDLTGPLRNEIIEVFSGKRLPPKPNPLAQAYSGHQFGHWNVLGDGRALLLAEIADAKGSVWDLHMKGSGPTAYSRRGDGLAALGPMLREVLMGEAMHALGVPTTRALCVTTTGDYVQRETPQPGAVLTRIAKSHLRVGSFELAARTGTPSELQTLLRFSVECLDADLLLDDPALDPNQIPPELVTRFFARVVERQARLIAQWMSVGFVHGVMNTDNMALSGETIDYGPCAWLNEFDPSSVFSSIDREGRYQFAAQPKIAEWNLTRLAECLLPLWSDSQNKSIELAQEQLAQFQTLFQQHYLDRLSHKLGFANFTADLLPLLQSLMEQMQESKADWTQTFVDLKETLLPASPTGSFPKPDWLSDWQRLLATHHRSLHEARELMAKTNPIVIPRNHRIEAILAETLETQDPTQFYAAIDALKNPFSPTLEIAREWGPPPRGAPKVVTFCGT